MTSIERKRHVDALSSVANGEFAFEYAGGTWKTASMQRLSCKRPRLASTQSSAKVSITSKEKHGGSRIGSDQEETSKLHSAVSETRRCRKSNPSLHEAAQPMHISAHDIGDLKSQVDDITSRLISWSLIDLKAWRKEQSLVEINREHEDKEELQSRMRSRPKEARREMLQVLRGQKDNDATKTND